MKKNKSIVLIATIAFIAILLFYYSKPFLVERETPRFSIVTSQDEANIVGKLKFQGYVQASGEYQNITVNENGTQKDDVDLRFSSYLGDGPKIKDLVHRYPSFMRNKDRYPLNFHETVDAIIYIEDYYQEGFETNPVKQAALPLAILDKNNNQEKLQEIIIDSNESFSYIYVNDVLISDKYLILDISIEWSNEQREIIVYDLAIEKVVNRLTRTIALEMDSYDVRFENYLIDDEKQLMLTREIGEIYPDQEAAEVKYEYAYQLYDFSKSTEEVIMLPDIFYGDDSQITAEDNALFALQRKKDSIHMVKFDWLEQKVVLDKTMPIDKEIMGDAFADFRLLSTKQGLLLTEYELQDSKDLLGFELLDMNDFNTLSKGYIHMEDAEAATEVFFDTISIDEKES